MSEGLAECEWISGVLESAVYQDYEPSLHRRKSISSAVEPTVTVMKADSHLQIDPSTVCVIDAKSAFDHLVRESTGGHCRRTAQELCVIRRSMLTLRARCRWVPHERMVVDALMKRHGNSVTMLRLMRDGVLSVVDEDRELAMIPQSDVTVKTESQSPLKEDPTQGWKQQGDWRQPQLARGYDRAKSKSTSQMPVDVCEARRCWTLWRHHAPKSRQSGARQQTSQMSSVTSPMIGSCSIVGSCDGGAHLLHR